MRFIQDKPLHIAQAMAWRVGAGHDGCVWWQRERDLRHGVGELHTPGGKGIEMWRFRSGRPRTRIRTQVVGTYCVQRDQEDVGVSWPGGARRLFNSPAAWR